MDESLIAREKAVAPSEQVTLEPALAHVLTEHFHDASRGGLILVSGQKGFHQDLAGHFVESIEPVGSGFIRTEYPEVLRFQVQLHAVAQESTEHPGCFCQLRTRLRNLHRV